MNKMQNEEAKSQKIYEYLAKKDITLLSEDSVRYCFINPYRFIIKHDTIQNRKATVDIFSVPELQGTGRITAIKSKKTNVDKSELSYIKAEKENIIINRESGEVIETVKERKRKKDKTSNEIIVEANRTKKQEIEVLNANFYPSRRFHSAFLTLTFARDCYDDDTTDYTVRDCYDDDTIDYTAYGCYDYTAYSKYVHDYIKALKRHFKAKNEEITVVCNAETGANNSNLHCHMLIGFKNKEVKKYLPTFESGAIDFRNSVFQKLWKQGNAHIDLLHKMETMQNFDELFGYMTKEIKKIKLFVGSYDEKGIAVSDDSLTPKQLCIKQSMQNVKVRCYNKSRNCKMAVWVDTDYRTAIDKLSKIENTTIDKNGRKCDIVKFDKPVQSVSAFTINEGKENEEIGLHIQLTYTRNFSHKHVYCDLNVCVPQQQQKQKKPPQQPTTAQQVYYYDDDDDDKIRYDGYFESVALSEEEEVCLMYGTEEDLLMYEEMKSGSVGSVYA